MWTVFALENLNFALNVFMSLVFLAVSWLYYDAYKALKNKRELWKVFGFIILAISFLFRGMQIEGITLSDIKNYQTLFTGFDIYLRLLGYILLIIGLLVDPLQPKPKLNAFFVLALPPLLFLSPSLAAIVAILYFRRSTVGLERHLFFPSISFFILSFYELTYSLNNFSSSTNLVIFNLLAPFGVFWIVRLILLFFVILFLGRWVFKYLLKQFQSQLFMIQMVLVLSIYLIVTVGFTGLLINNLKSQILNELTSEAKVLEFAFNARKEELLQTAKQIAINPTLIDSNTNVKHDSLTIFDKDGLVTFRAEDSERKGDSISGDSLVKLILEGKEASNIVVKDNSIAPVVMIIAGSPVMNEGELNGGVLVGDIIDNSYIDGFSKLTGLKSAIYGADTLSAGGEVGTKEGSISIKEKVLTKGETYIAETRWQNQSYLSVYSPLKNVEGNTVGMFFVGRSQAEVLGLAAKTLEIVFLGTIILLFLTMIPAKMISVSISKQIK